MGLLHRTRMKNGLTLRVERDVAAFGPEWDPLFASGIGLQSSRAWIAATTAAAIPAGAIPHLLALSDAAGPAAFVPMLAGSNHEWGSLTTPYTCLYQPLLRAEPPVAPADLRMIGRYCRQWPITKFEALDPDEPGLQQLRASLASAGLVTRTFSNFGNWYETIAPGGWDIYLRGRPGALRETIRRRTRDAAKSGLRIQIEREQVGLDVALAAYEHVYQRSWKDPEPYPAFNAALVRGLAEAGVLRIGILWRDDEPIAAQYWSVVNKSATVLKLAHDKELNAFSPGTVLTAATIRGLIEIDGIRELDFGRGDDPYKRGWVGERRLRVGLLGLDVRTLTGLREWAVHDLGAIVRAVKSGAKLRRKVSTTANAAT